MRKKQVHRPPERLAHLFEYYDIVSKSTPERVELLSRVVEDVGGVWATRAGWVYLIRSGRSDYYKIGLAKDPKVRLHQLQVGNPEELSIVHTIECEDVVEVEDGLHNRFVRQHHRGEWYRLSAEDVERVRAYKEK